MLICNILIEIINFLTIVFSYLDWRLFPIVKLKCVFGVLREFEYVIFSIGSTVHVVWIIINLH